MTNIIKINWCFLKSTKWKSAGINEPKKLNKEHNISGHKWSTKHRVLKSHRSKMSIIYMLSRLCSSYFCEIWALCVLRITYDHLCYAPFLACWALFGSLVPAMSNRTSCAQVYGLPQSHCADNQEGKLFSW